MQSTRRDMLKLALAGSTASLFLPMNAQQRKASPPSSEPPTDSVPAGTRGKFSADGSVLPFAGNTVISHLPAECALRDAAVALHDALLASPVHSAFAILPPASYHMTVFSGINDKDRTTPAWPSGFARDTPIEECTRIINYRLADFVGNCPMPIRMRLDKLATSRYTSGCSLRLRPVDDDQNKSIRELRDQLSEVFGLRASDHATYEFHITIAYQLRNLAPADDLRYRTLLSQRAEQIATAAPILELGLPEFCSFQNMYRYDILRYLRTG